MSRIRRQVTIAVPRGRIMRRRAGMMVGGIGLALVAALWPISSTVSTAAAAPQTNHPQPSTTSGCSGWHTLGSPLVTVQVCWRHTEGFGGPGRGWWNTWAEIRNLAPVDVRFPGGQPVPVDVRFFYVTSERQNIAAGSCAESGRGFQSCAGNTISDRIAIGHAGATFRYRAASLTIR